jgi:hypothetical protein
MLLFSPRVTAHSRKPSMAVPIPTSSTSSRAAWQPRAVSSRASPSWGGFTEPPGNCQRPGAAVDGGRLDDVHE